MIAEIIRRLETAEDTVKTLSNDNVRSTKTNCLEVALNALREDQIKMEDQFKEARTN